MALLLACLGAGLIVPSLATAEPSSFYSSFSKCPTGLPEMNDPSTEEAACFSNISHHGSMKVGSFDVTFPGPLHLQFAVAGLEGEDGVVHVVPGSTTLEAPTVFIPSPFANAAPPAQPDQPRSQSAPSSPAPNSAPAGAKKAVKKPHRKAKRHKRKKRRHGAKKGRRAGHRRGRAGTGSAHASAVSEPQIGITPVLVGDVPYFNLLVAGSEEVGVVGMKLTMKLHLEGENLGSECFIGSDAEPVLVEPMKTKPESTYFFGHDPNGFKISLLGSGGTKLEDATLTLPAASGCGLGGLFNSRVDEAVGLPAPSGASRMVFGDNQFEFVGAGYDGVPPEGGAELQAAFDAAAG